MSYSWSNGGWRKSNFARLGGQFLDFSLNHSPARLAYGKFDWNDPRSLARWSGAPFVGSVVGGRKTELENQENDKYWDEMAQYYGFDKASVPYPMRSGIVPASGVTVSGQLASSVINQYEPLLRKWIK